MNIASLGTPFALRLMLAALLALAGALGIGWWSYTSQISRLTKERNAVLESVGVLRDTNDKLVLAIETQNGAFATYQIRANALISASMSATDAAIKAGEVLAGANKTLRNRVLPTDPVAACNAADALILEFVR